MTGFLSALSFATPLALAALLLLPVIWWLLRFTPPKPDTVRFPRSAASRPRQPRGTARQDAMVADAAAAGRRRALVILGVAHPLYAPGRVDTLSSTPLLLVVDDSWPAARDWDKRLDIMNEVLDGARSAGATVSLALTTPQLRAQSLDASDSETIRARVKAMAPRAIDPDRPATLASLQKVFASSSALRVIGCRTGSIPAMLHPLPKD